MRVGICGPHRLLRQALGLALSRSDDLQVAAVHRLAARLPNDLDGVVLAFPESVGALADALREVDPVPMLVVGAGALAGGLPPGAFCDEACSVAEVEAKLRMLVAEPSPVAVLALDSGDAETTRLQLTDRELQVLRLLSRGLTAAQVAEQLELSPRTIESHKERLFAKLGVRSQSLAVATAVREGLLTPGSQDRATRS